MDIKGILGYDIICKVWNWHNSTTGQTRDFTDRQQFYDFIKESFVDTK